MTPKGPLPQALVTVCVPLPYEKDFPHVRDGEVNHLLDQLGNPLGATRRHDGQPGSAAGKALAEALDELDIVHFFSLVLVPPFRAGERSWLVLELSGDGEPAALLDAFADATGPHLLPVFKRACAIGSLSALKRELKRRRRRLSQWIPGLTLLPGRSIGAPFIGGPGLSVAQIRFDREIADLSEAVIARLARETRPDPAEGPKAWLNAVIAHLKGDDPLALASTPPRPGDGRDALLRDAEQRVRLASGLWDDRARHAPPPADEAALGADLSQWQLIRVLASAPIFIAGLIMALACLALVALATGPDGMAQLNPFAPGAFGFGWLGRLSVFVATSLVLFGLASGGLALLLKTLLNRSERRNSAAMPDLDPDTVSAIMQRENRTPAQNHMVSVTEIIDEPYRKFVTLPAAFNALAQALTKGVFAPGRLADIGTIHFARWINLPRSNRLVFFSNYDGNWESYLEDFISKASVGLTGIWSNCQGFPATENLFQKGAEDGDRFKRWARHSMIPTRVWYSAYPDLTMHRIRRSARIRDGLLNATTQDEAEDWLALFDSAPRPENALETSDMQTLLLSGLRRHLQAAGLVVRFPDTAGEAACRAWLAETEPLISTGRGGLDDALTQIAFSAEGLGRLGLAGEVATTPPSPAGPPDAATRFPVAFTFDMDHPTRRRMLGDLGKDGSDRWIWGRRGEVHALLLLYARPSGETAEGEAKLDALIDAHAERLQRHGLTLAHTIRMQPFPAGRTAIRDPFGYVDGISQPRIKGLDRRGGPDDPAHDVEAGEFILGYRDNRGYVPPSLLVDAGRDSGEVLAAPSGQASDGLKDFGRNGSFLVVRQLQQDVKAFSDWIHTQATQLRFDTESHLSDISEELIYAKVMGRWRSGHPLVRYPASVPAPPASAQPMALEAANLENDFDFGRSDPQGHRCPFGAHIRRANPRDSLNPDNPLTLSITNRHRILRRGRFYTETDTEQGAERQGTFFIALNADIERQFEFIQQNWMNAPGFHGLTDEIDPIVGKHACEDGCPSPYTTHSLPSEHGPDQLTNWKSFVRLRGGGYFFLPGRRALRFLATGPADTGQGAP